MDDSTLDIGPTHDDADWIRLERIPSPFVWAPREPVYIQVAVVGGTLAQRAETTAALRSSGHRVTQYSSAAALVQLLGRPDQRHVQPYPLDVVVLHGSGDTTALIGALESLRSYDGGVPIVLVADDNDDVLAEARRLCVEEVLAPPVHPVALSAAVASAVYFPVEELIFDD